MTPNSPDQTDANARATRLALTLILVLTGLRLVALFSTPLELYPDEAQYWLWSRTLDFGYFSKPPMLAWSIWLTTHIGGDSEAWVRLSAPLFHAVAGLALFAAGRRLYGPWTGLAAAAVYSLMPGIQLASGVITADTPLLCFLALTLLAYAMIQAGERRPLVAAGLGAALGLAMLSKYAALYALIGIGLHLALSREARRAWDAKTAAVAGLAFLAILAPNIIWNAGHGFATVSHTAANANWGAGRLFNPGEMATFIGEQFGVFGPVPFAVLIGGAAVLAWRRRLQPNDVLLLCLTLPPLVAVTIQAFISRANGNWAASAYVAGSVLVAALLVRWRARWLLGAGLVLQAVVALLFLTWTARPEVADAMGRSNDIKRARGWEQMTERVIQRAETEQANGGLSAIAVDDRFLFNAMSYYGRDYFGRPDAAPLTIWLRGAAGNQAEATAPLTVRDGRRVLAVALEGKASQRMAADFARADTVEIVSVLLSPKCRAKAGEKPERFDHRCRRRATVILGEDFRPVARP